MGLYLKQEQPLRMASSIVGLSSLELELLLDMSLEQIINFHKEDPKWKEENLPESRGNYYWQSSFVDACRTVKGKIPKEKHLETPQIFVEREGESYSAKYDSRIDTRIAEKLSRFKRADETGKVPVEKIFSKQFAKDRQWMIEQQQVMVKYLCETQHSYLQTGNPFDLKTITQKDVAEQMGYSDSTISRLARNLSLQLPDGRIIFASELFHSQNHGNYNRAQQGILALKQLQSDPKLYENGSWKVSDQKLVPLLKERCSLNVARRTVSKYRSRLSTTP